MFDPRFKLRALARRLSAVTLGLWLAGAGCLLVCEAKASEVEDEEDGRPAQTESCPAFSGSDCCRHNSEESSDGDEEREVREDDAAASSAQTATTSIRRSSHSTSETKCCPLGGQSADSSRRISVSDNPETQTGSLMKFTSRLRTRAELHSHHPRAQDRGGTHLRCCVFLI